MLDVILRQTRLEKDLNGDGFIDFGEYIGPRGDNPNGAVDLERQREMFDAGHDLDGDGLLDADEFKRWVAPSNESVNGSPPHPHPPSTRCAENGLTLDDLVDVVPRDRSDRCRVSTT